MDDFIHRYIAAGQTSIANYLIDHYREVGMSNDQFLIYLQVRRQIDRGDELPDAEILAQRLGWDKSRVYQVLHELISGKLMSIATVTNSQGQKQDSYDFSLLTDKLSHLAAQETRQTVQKAATTDRATVFNQIETEFGRPLSPLEMESINQWLDEDHYQPELIQLALKEAVLSQAYSLKYMDRILLSWEKKHLTTAVQVQRERERQEPRRSKAPDSAANTAIPDVPIFKLTDR
ncbi:primosome component related protein [Levilactobacillus senmaizukei DSM 21775 = NBRC 103853]|uniref:Primosome component related protein n=1 Tax=Levilactobacillus senmaizukei DSM 21775 = NBRC 103853 TaxID=1423803 RepID=A0A0R2DFY3_9LACO|nr:DnaD domain protein [Levilactobacillus senmaizukei]KRN02227.1 primosome component related protein [Levilactobacillus senmaizukei DSM 21775 = NBRC 103853]